MNQKTALKQLKELSKYGNHLRLAAESWSEEWQSLISTMLSARTKDETTIDVCNVLFDKYKSLRNLAKAKFNDVASIIRRVNYYKTKTKNVLNCAKMLISEHNGKVPHDLEKLIELPGVGRKTANVFLSEVGKDAIGVDTHLSYTARMLSWSKNKNPHKIEEDLKRLFPKNHWKRLNSIVVRFGRTYTKRREKDALLDKIKKLT